MATKTISIDLEAYDRLVGARSSGTESFSKVIKRAEWKQSGKNGAALLSAIMENEPMAESDLKRIERAKAADRPPRKKW